MLLAHRGLAQTFTREDLERDTCTATRIHPPEHEFIENTLPSMEAAFAAGADVVEFDVHPTTDGNFAVFHDWTLDCRTEGNGHDARSRHGRLKPLDVGYGYTADGGKTFPLRGKGVGLMPTLDEVLATFPDKRFLINVKSNDASEGEKLAAHLQSSRRVARAPDGLRRHDRRLELVHAKLPDVPIGSNKSLKSCLIRYSSLGWSGYVPRRCRTGMMLVPLNFAPWLWGWPDIFHAAHGRAPASHVFVLGPYDGSFGTSGVDDLDSYREAAEGFAGGIWTNRIDRIGAAVRGNAMAP